DELRKLAAHKLAREKPGQTLQATALVHEAYLRLVARKRCEADGPESPDCDDHQAPHASRTSEFANRTHFLAAAAQAMRRILVEKARQKRCTKHGGEMERAHVDLADLSISLPDDELLALEGRCSPLFVGVTL